MEQHARIRQLFTKVKSSRGAEKREAFDELRALLAVHETTEEMIVRPVAAETAGKREADARNEEEAEANKVLAGLEKTDVDSAQFDARLAEFERAVLEHAENEAHPSPTTFQGGTAQDARPHELLGVRGTAQQPQPPPTRTQRTIRGAGNCATTSTPTRPAPEEPPQDSAPFHKRRPPAQRTHFVAPGRASSRASGIASPHSSHRP
ncbi:hemerythrin domain-containing protein [Streptomyces sp. NPDC005574]|uniref:hemerythrin domain-containing protein n=1 Tax=Streptomyces sp. NPDC005574 TaxID=3156891 RepID=UPI0033B75D62